MTVGSSLLSFGAADDRMDGAGREEAESETEPASALVEVERVPATSVVVVGTADTVSSSSFFSSVEGGRGSAVAVVVEGAAVLVVLVLVPVVVGVMEVVDVVVVVVVVGKGAKGRSTWAFACVKPIN